MCLNTVMLDMKLNLFQSKTQTATQTTKDIVKLTHLFDAGMFHYEASKLNKNYMSASEETWAR